MGWFSKSKKYVVAIALIGALSSACQKALPKEEATRLSGMSDTIQRQLKKGEVDRDRIREFARLVARADTKYNVKGVHIPENLVDGINDLRNFYYKIEELTAYGINFRSPISPIFDPGDWAQNPLLNYLFAAERHLSIRLDEERAQATRWYEAVLTHFEREIQRAQRGETKAYGSQSSIDVNSLERRKAKVERAISDLRK